jgi:hypothetical protein
MTDPKELKAPPGALRRTLLRVLAVVLIVLVLHQLLNWATAEAAQGASRMRFWVLALFLLVYALLIAVPFVPGVEVGLTLMAIEGPWIAPWIYLTTVAGLVLAFACGEGLSYPRLHRILADLGMRRACQLIERLQPLDKAQRLQLLEQRAPAWAKPLVTHYRYVVMALLINLPGSSLIGGGGGLMFLSGFSRLFRTGSMILTILVAVAPVPLAFWAFGFDVSALL